MTWPYAMTTPYWSDFVPNSTFYRILSGFHRTFTTGVACRQGTLTPSDTWSRSIGTCICSTCQDQSFSELVVILPDYALRISLGTFSILLVYSGIKVYQAYPAVDDFLILTVVFIMQAVYFCRIGLDLLKKDWMRKLIQRSMYKLDMF